MTQRFVILTPDSYYGSFGDQAMIVSTVANLSKTYKDAEFILFNVYNAPADDIFTQTYGLNVKTYYPTSNVIKEFADIARGATAVYVIGADIMDGAYSEEAAMVRYKLLDVAHALGVKTSILGFSFYKKPSKNICKTVKYISKHTMLNVRDIDSLTRLREIGCKNLKLVADTAFLFDEAEYKKSPSAEELYKNLLKIKHKTIIGVNITHSRSTDCKPFITKICDALSQLKNIYVVIFPHDIRTYDNSAYFDGELCQMLGDELLSRGIECINTVNYLENEIDVKHILNLVDFVVSCRMHLAIASLSKGIPVISFGYNDKFEGLYKFYGLDNNLILQRDCDVSQIVNSIKYVMNHNLKKRIVAKNCYVFRMAKKNFCSLNWFNPFLLIRKNHVNKYFCVIPNKGPYYNFVSLGWDCLSRTILTWWNMKHTKAEGELSMPFDLAMHQIKSTIKILNNDFADFFETLRFDEQTQNWYNDKYWNVYNHDQTCLTVDDFKARYSVRINNFRNAIQNVDNVFFVYHDRIQEWAKKRDIKKLAKTLRRLRGTKKFRLIIISNKYKHIRAKNISVIYAKEPYIDYVWWDDEHKTMLANEYEFNIIKKIMRICKKYTFIWNLTGKIKNILHINK